MANESTVPDGSVPPLAPNGSQPESKCLVLKLALKSARARMTRTCSKTDDALAAATESVDSIDQIDCLRSSMSGVLAELSAATQAFINLPSVCADEELMSQEFTKHDLYVIKVEDALSALQQKRNEIARRLGLEPDVSALPQNPQDTHNAQSSPHTDQNSFAGADDTAEFQSYNEQHQSSASESAPQDATASSQQQASDAKVFYIAQDPATKVPKFSGDPMKFAEWWDLFHHYVDSKPLETTEKCRILKTSIVGKAARTIFHLPVSRESYQIAKTIIRDRFGGTSKAQDAHLQQINRICSMRDLERKDKFADFISMLSQHVNSLVELGNTFDALSVTLCPLILASIPESYRMKFNASWRKLESSDVAKLQCLMDFLADQAFLIEESREQAKFALNQSGSRFPNKISSDKNRSNVQNSKNGAHHDSGSRFSFAGNGFTPNHSCIFCEKDHSSVKCTKKLSPEERRKRIVAENGCLRCLRRNHDVKKCRAKVDNCSSCSGRHNKLVCLSKDPGTPGAQDNGNNSKSCASAGVAQPTETLLQTAYAWLVNGDKKILARVLLDSGSQISLVSSRVAKLLGLRKITSSPITLNGVAGQRSHNEAVETVKLKLRSRFTGSEINISCLSVPIVIKGPLPSASVPDGFSPIADLKEPGFPVEVDLLVGADWLHLIYSGMYRKAGSLTAVPTKLGWVFWGINPVKSIQSSVITSMGIIQVRNNRPTAAPERQASRQELEGLEFLWNTELLGIENSTPDENKSSALEMERWFQDSVQVDLDGRYIVSLPFKDNIQALGDNQKLAYSRLVAFLKANARKPHILAAVDREIQKGIDDGHIELAEPRIPGQPAHYLPLLAVAKQSLVGSSELRVRVVKDGGARSRDEASLNDVLEKGPNCVPDIIGVLLSFRRPVIAIVADIEKAFMQFRINREHRTFLRFFYAPGWVENRNAPIKEFWATRLDFGLVCSTWLHCAGIKHHLDLQIKEHPDRENFLREIQSSFYVDDIPTGANTLLEAEAAVEALIDTFKAGHFPLNKWATNSSELAGFISKIQGLGCKVASGMDDYKFLGIPWELQKDSLHINVRETAKFLGSGTPTKRRLLQGLSQIFDPLGIVASISVGLKVLTQTLWDRQIDWDQPLTGSLLEAYSTSISALDAVSEVSVGRRIFSYAKADAKRELHVFADASLRAYGCIAYIREIPHQSSSNVSVRFLMAKARVAPLKGIWTIHRLELVAAVLACRIARKIQVSLAKDIDSISFYSDNSSVLGWIRDKADRWKAFVENRIKEIQSSSHPNQWSYIRSAENPADLLSRCSPLDSEDLRKFWLQGPPWLTQNESPAEHRLNPKQEDRDVISEKKTVTISAAAVRSTSIFLGNQSSSWPRAVRVTAFTLRFIRAIRKEKIPSELSVDAEEFQNAENFLLKNIQSSYFAEELSTCVDRVPAGSPLAQLNPFIGEGNFLRCRTRLEKSSDLTYDERYPVILPGEEFLVQLYLRWLHAGPCLHSGGIAAVLHKLRSRFFITSARRVTKKALNGCKVCIKFRAKQASERIPPLPAFRIEQCPPFSITGVDHAGPIQYKSSDGVRSKSYVLLFVCAVTRAVRLELVSDLSTEEFLLALRRFVSRNPAVSTIISDNARTFKKADKEISLWFQYARLPQTQGYLARNKIKWQYSTEKAPWMGGFWERMVQVVKRPLRKILGIHCLPFRHLDTVLIEIERMVNDRPLCAVSCDPSEPRALTPAQLLYGYSGSPPLPELKRVLQNAEASTAIIFSERWRHQQSVLRGFWKQFHTQYLQSLRSAHYAKFQDSRPLKVGDVALLHSSEPSRAFWPLCRVESLFGGEGSDGRQRSCTIRTASGQTLRRPIQLIYPLEVSDF